MGKSLTINKSPGKKELIGSQSLSQLSEQIRDLKNLIPVMTPIDSIPVMEAFKNLFPIKPVNLERIAESIRLNGFDEKFSIIIAQFPDGFCSLVAGFTRMKGAVSAGLTEIPAWKQDFPSVEAAIEWALHEQFDRRNLNDDEIYETVLRIDEFTKKETDGFKGKSSIRTAEIAGLSARKVERIRAVEKEASENQKKAIRNGEKSINRIYQEIKDNKAPPGAPETSHEKNWTIEIRGANVSLIRKGEEMILINFSPMNLLYNGAPEKKLIKVVEEYMETVL